MFLNSIPLRNNLVFVYRTRTFFLIINDIVGVVIIVTECYVEVEISKIRLQKSDLLLNLRNSTEYFLVSVIRQAYSYHSDYQAIPWYVDQFGNDKIWCQIQIYINASL